MKKLKWILSAAAVSAAGFSAFLATSCMESNPTKSESAPVENDLAVAASTVQPGFTDVLVAGGLSNPTQMEIAPDGRIFVSEQGGKLRVIKNDALLATPFLTVNVSTVGERGLLGIAFDPDFATEKWVYIYHTSPSGPHNVVSRFLVSSTNPDVADPTEHVLLNLPSTLCACGYHNSGGVHFGKDGKLYISVGESTVGARAESLTTTMGKILRINKDGSIPSDNPYLSQTKGSNQSIYAMGFRNPYTFAVQPGTGRIFVNDVGNQTWEEIDDLKPGKDYGWPNKDGAIGNPKYVDPFYTYNHSSGACAIAGGAFYNPTTVRFPSDYVGDYFFGDYCGNWIKKIDLTTKAVTTFVSGINKPTDLKVGNDGNLYYVARGAGQVRKVSSTTSQAPFISDQPASLTVALGEAATFTVAASGPAPLSYQWQRDDADISGAVQSSFTLGSTVSSDNGAKFRCIVKNASGSATSNEAALTVLNDHRPTAHIDAPATNLHYNAGDVINFSGTGTDAEEGNLNATSMTWEVRFFHNDGNAHFHPFMAPTSGIAGGSFTTSTQNETSPNVWYAIYLTVADAQGLMSTDSVVVVPNTVQVTLASSPADLQLNIDGHPQTSPYTFTGVVGIMRNIEAVSPQSSGGSNYQFTSWSDGGAANHDIATPSANATLTATYAVSAATLFEAEAAAFSGPAVTTKHPGYTGTGYLDFINSNGDYVEFTVPRSSAGTVTLTFRYANGSGATIKTKITVNGAIVNGGLGMPVTGTTWETWKTVTQTATLNAGSNKIRMSTIGVGQPNVDNVTVN